MDKKEIDLFLKEENRKRKQEFEEKLSHSDLTLLYKLYDESRNLGYDIQYPYDYMYIGDKATDLIPILIKYIGRFENEGISDQLIGALGIKNFYEATEFLLKEFKKIKSKSHVMRRWWIAESIASIRDKRFINVYIDLIKDENYKIDTDRFVLLLGEWKNEEALSVILELLSCNEKQIILAAIKAVGYYKKNELKKFIEPFIAHNDKDIRKLAEKTLQKL